MRQSRQSIRRRIQRLAVVVLFAAVGSGSSAAEPDIQSPAPRTVIASTKAALSADDRATHAKFRQRPEFAERAKLDEQLRVEAGKHSVEEREKLLIRRAELAERIFDSAKQLPGFPETASDLADDLIRSYTAAGEDCRRRSAYEQAMKLYDRLAAALARGYGKDYWRCVDARLAARSAEFSVKATFGVVMGASGGMLALAGGKNLESQGRYEEAIAQFQKAAQAFERAFGKESAEFILAVKLQAEVRRAQGKFDEAARLFVHCRDLAEKVYGKRHPGYATTLGDLGSLQFSRANYPEAHSLHTSALAIYESTIGEKDAKYALMLNNIGACLNNLTRLREAEPLLLEALKITRERLGTRSEQYGLVLLNLGYHYSEKADFAKAASFHGQAVAAYEKALGKQHRSTLDALMYQAKSLLMQEKHAAAEPLLLDVLARMRSLVGERHPSVAGCLLNLGWLQHERGDYAGAEGNYLAALDIQREVSGERSKPFASALSYLACLRWSQGNYDEAIATFERMFDIYRIVTGENSVEYALALSQFGCTQSKQGRYSEAEQANLKAVEIYEKLLEPNHTALASARSNLAFAYAGLGNFAEAERLYRRAAEVFRSAYGPDSVAYSRTLRNLGQVYLQRGEYQLACEVLEESHRRQLSTFGKEHDSYPRSLTALAGAYRQLGRLDEALALLEEARTRQERLTGKSHPDYAATVLALASVLGRRNKLDEARKLVAELVERTRVEEGEEYPGLPRRLMELAVLEHAAGNFLVAEGAAREALERSQSWTERVMESQAERRQLALAASQARMLDAYLAIAVDAGEFTEQAYRFALRHKGSAWMQQRRLRAAADDPAAAPLFLELQRTTSQLAEQAMRDPKPERQEAWREEIERLIGEKENLERRLAGASAEYRAARRTASLEEVRNALSDHIVLADFIEYERNTRQANDIGTATSPTKFMLHPERRLAAFLVRREGPIELIDLGRIDVIAAAIDVWRSSFGASSESLAAGETLRKLLWVPLESRLGAAQTVLISPDGALGRLPPAALPGRKPGTYLIEDVAVAIVPVAQALPTVLGDSPKAGMDLGNLLLVGGVDYDAAEDSAPKPAKKLFGRRVMRGAEWRDFQPLTGAVGEIAVIEKTYRDIFGDEGLTRLERALADEERFKNEAPKHLYIHVATHGFFAPPGLRSTLTVPSESSDRVSVVDENTAGRGVDMGASPIVGQHPGLLSGLALAGANRPPSADRPDGILTAEEVQTLDLRKVDLAVLSACETGLGEVAGGEGLLGLQRSFQVAGARTTIASYWKVDDIATRQLMERFYHNLWDREMPRLAALREAQLFILRNPDALRGVDLVEEEPKLRTSPRFWAAFSLSGDWR